jgi:hypothetical protein
MAFFKVQKKEVVEEVDFEEANRTLQWLVSRVQELGAEVGPEQVCRGAMGSAADHRAAGRISAA